MGRTNNRLAQLAVATAVVAGGVGVVTAPAASAASVTCTIDSVTNASTAGYKYVNVTCKEGSISPPDFIYDVQIWGEDTWSDDYLATVYPPNYYPASLYVHGSVLNEDYGDKDDIYVKVRFQKSTGGLYSVRSNTVHGWWS
ncbi:hypothetical protein SAMN04489712_102683 [Thermomonospora echinospora]|uniref:Uncharacterized protein n=1 Tax=Thermomonospora echinospora TaxID=1992 RepID=A0A1H5WDL8_9ACTN|nr:hypothetical protein [Thermomonospora echinospora]SEF97575.1 hypothetical protein SAMN04489712_102683 [Thermomonospora echinospora]